MIKEILYRWFNLSPFPCQSCELLRETLHKSEDERKELLHRLLDKDKQIESPIEKEEHVPIHPQFIPWRVRQQMLEAEDRKKAQLMKEREVEINKLENELGVASAPSGGVKFEVK